MFHGTKGGGGGGFSDTPAKCSTKKTKLTWYLLSLVHSYVFFFQITVNLQLDVILGYSIQFNFFFFFLQTINW